MKKEVKVHPCIVILYYGRCYIHHTYLCYQGPETVPFPYTSLEWQSPQQQLVLQQKVTAHHQNLPSKVHEQRGNAKTLLDK